MNVCTYLARADPGHRTAFALVSKLLCPICAFGPQRHYLWTHIRGFEPTHQNRDAKENRILFMIRGLVKYLTLDHEEHISRSFREYNEVDLTECPSLHLSGSPHNRVLRSQILLTPLEAAHARPPCDDGKPLEHPVKVCSVPPRSLVSQHHSSHMERTE